MTSSKSTEFFKAALWIALLLIGGTIELVMVTQELLQLRIYQAYRFHLLACASGGMGVALYSRFYPFSNLRAPLLFSWLLALALPLLGYLSGGMVVIIYFVGSRVWRSGLLHAYSDYIFKDLVYNMIRRERERPASQILQESRLESFVNVMRRTADPEHKALVLEKLVRHSSPQTIKLVREALSDEAMDVRFQAGAALMRLEDEMLTSIHRLRFEAASLQQGQAYYRLGEALRGYIVSTIPPHLEIEPLLDEAEGAYQKALELKPNTSAYSAGLARIQILRGRLDEAKALLKEQPCEGEVGYLLGEITYLQRRYGELANLLQSFDESGLSEAQREVVAFWKLELT